MTIDQLLFGVFPYVAIIIAVVGTIWRYYNRPFSFSSLSSQFLENRQLFWGSVPWHYGILLILTAHLLAWLFPGIWANIIGAPTRLYILEVTGLALALTTLVSLILLIWRRLSSSRILIVTSFMDWVLLLVLLTQVALGFWVALFFRWGADWYVHTAAPWLSSLFTLNPEVQHVSALPWVVKYHLLGGFIILTLFPFTRLVHMLSFPIGYLWRPVQVVIWNRWSPPPRN